jgi:hypothetical protein
MASEYDLEELQVNLKIKYLNNIIAGCSKTNLNYDNVKKELNNYEQENNNFTITEQKNKNKIEMDEGLSEKKISDKEPSKTETETIDYLYLKPWSKLTQIHKVIKIKEFVNNLDIKNVIEKENLKDKLIDQIKEKKSKNKINYDDTKGKILSISNLSHNNDKYILI